MVVTISPSFSLYKIVVFPAASSPTTWNTKNTQAICCYNWIYSSQNTLGQSSLIYLNYGLNSITRLANAQCICRPASILTSTGNSQTC